MAFEFSDPSLPFEGKVVLITGAASGLGRRLALGLSKLGATIASVDQNATALKSLNLELKNDRNCFAEGDVTEMRSIQKTIEHCQEKLGPVDILIANAGILREQHAAQDFGVQDIAAQVAVNLIGVANSIAAVLPQMLARTQGHIVVISSLASYRGLPHLGGYCASKAGVRTLTESIRFELQPKGILVTTICPGWIETPLSTHIATPLPFLINVEEASQQIILAILRKKTFYAFPIWPLMLVRMLRWLPARISDWLLKWGFPLITKIAVKRP